MDTPTRTSPRATRELWRSLTWRVLAFVVVFVVAIVGFATGVGVTERDMSGTGLAEKAYYALGLFVLGGLDIGTPVGGPMVGRTLLWAAYFLSPIITVSAVLETAFRLMRPLAHRVRLLSDHVVLGERADSRSCTCGSSGSGIRIGRLSSSNGMRGIPL